MKKFEQEIQQKKQTEGKKTAYLEQCKKEYSVLPERVKAIIWGLVLGDGSLKRNKGYKNARLSFRHSIKQREYFNWKVSELRPWLSSEKDVWEQNPQEGEKGGKKLRYQSGAKRSLTYVYHQVYKESTSGEVKIRRRWLNEMTPLSLAVWWCDDGSLVGNRSQGLMCTDGYRVEDVKRLSQYLREKWGVRTKEVDTGNTTKAGYTRYRLHIETQLELQKWLRIIMGEIPTETMLNKVLLLYKEPDLQERWISELSKNTKYEKERIEKLCEREKAVLKNYKTENDIVQSRESPTQDEKDRPW